MAIYGDNGKSQKVEDRRPKVLSSMLSSMPFGVENQNYGSLFTYQL